MTASPSPHLRSPLTRGRLIADTAWSLADVDGRRWPVLDGIPYLRTGRDELAACALARLDVGDRAGALVALLADQDDWWTGSRPVTTDLARLVAESGRLTLRDAMGLLAFERVGDYFAHRWSDPTFLAGLALIEAHRGPMRSAFELACGIGHYGREFLRRGLAYRGGDVVFSKLWLARHWILGAEADLVCFDAASPWPVADGAYDLVLCHDAFYFLEPKAEILDRLRSLVAPHGWLAVGHIHNREAANHSAGRALTIEEVCRLFPDAVLYDDAELTHALAEARLPIQGDPGRLREVEAFAVACGPGLQRQPRVPEGGYAMPATADPAFVLNPLYAGLAAPTRVDPAAERAGPEAVWEISFPSERYAAEYGPLATYPARFVQPADADARVQAIRRRALVELPERW